jgi:hypothetical protein
VDTNALREDLCHNVVTFMPKDEGILAIDETGFLKKGPQWGLKSNGTKTGSVAKIFKD